MKNRFNDVVTVQYQKCCSDREEVRDFVDRIRDENPDIVFFRRELTPDPTTEESVLVNFIGWYDYRDTGKPKKKRSKEALSSKELK